MTIYLPKSFEGCKETELSTKVPVTLGEHDCPPYRASYCQGMFILCQPIGADWYSVGHWPAAAILAKPAPKLLSIDFGQQWSALITPELLNKLKEVAV